MSTRLLTFVAAAALAAAGPLSAAQPFGSFGGIVGGGNAGGGVIGLHGWALDDDGVASVDIMVDRRVIGRAQYGRQRPGVTQSFPGYPDSDAPGFAFELDSTRFRNGVHAVNALVTTETGETVLLSSRSLSFTNLTHDLRPFGRLERPNPDAELLGSCSLQDPQRRYTVVSGYALDVGVEVGDQGVGYVELLIDGAIYANSVTSCHHDPVTGGLTDCYGLRRLDVARFYPNLSDAPLSGFRFVLDVGALIGLGINQPGRHVLLIRAGDIAGQVADIAEIPVFFSCDDFVPNDGAFGRVNRPRNGLIYNGTVEANGWALDWEGVNRVIVYVDGFQQGDAVYGLSRPQVSMQYPGYPDSAAPGWTFALDTTTLSNAHHQMQVVVRDDEGVDTLIGQREFVVFNP